MADCFSLPNATELVLQMRLCADEKIVHCKECKFVDTVNDMCMNIMVNRAADAIEQLMQENAKLKGEREAAVRDLKISSDCDFCKYNADDPLFCDKSPRGDECMGKRWEWRGVQDA